MELNSYQNMAMRTKGSYSSVQDQILCSCLGIAGEAGELIDNIKKAIYHQKVIPDVELQKELGDLLWYIALLCDSKGWNMNDIARLNVEKLIKRYPAGFSFTQANLPRLD